MDNTKLKSDIVSNQRILRWDLYYCSLDQDINPESGSVLIGKPNRPCLIVSSNKYNQISDKVLVMPYCSNNRDDLTDEQYVCLARSKGETLIPMVLNRNSRSFLIIDQPRLISRKMIQGYVGTLDVESNRALAIKVEEAIFDHIIDKDVFMDSSIFKNMVDEYNKKAKPVYENKTTATNVAPIASYYMNLSKEENKKYKIVI